MANKTRSDKKLKVGNVLQVIKTGNNCFQHDPNRVHIKTNN